MKKNHYLMKRLEFLERILFDEGLFDYFFDQEKVMPHRQVNGRTRVMECQFYRKVCLEVGRTRNEK